MRDGLITQYPFLTERWATRLIKAYGNDAFHVLGDAKAATDLGQDFGGSLSEREVNWLIEKEYAHTAEDILWRRSKLGLVLSKEQIKALNTWMISARET